MPHFPLVCQRLLQRDKTVPLVYLIFDVLAIDGESTLHLPYEVRRNLLDGLQLRGRSWETPPSFEDGEALMQVVRESGLEGVVAKKLTGRYRPGERDWIKAKNRAYWRYPFEVEAAIRSRSDRATAV